MKTLDESLLLSLQLNQLPNQIEEKNTESYTNNALLLLDDYNDDMNEILDVKHDDEQKFINIENNCTDSQKVINNQILVNSHEIIENNDKREREKKKLKNQNVINVDYDIIHNIIESDCEIEKSWMIKHIEKIKSNNLSIPSSSLIDCKNKQKERFNKAKLLSGYYLLKVSKMDNGNNDLNNNMRNNVNSHNNDNNNSNESNNNLQQNIKKRESSSLIDERNHNIIEKNKQIKKYHKESPIILQVKNILSSYIIGK